MRCAIVLSICGLLLCAGCGDQQSPQPPTEHTAPALTQERAPTASTIPAPAADLPAELELSERAVLAWFDTLGFPDLANRKFVRVIFGPPDDPNNEQPATDEPITYGFLQSDGEHEFTVFTLAFLLKPCSL